MSSMPRTKLTADCTRNCRVLPDRFALLDALPKKTVAAEVGVASGDYTKEILRRTDPACLHLIDAWSTIRYSSGMQHVEERFQQEIAHGKVLIHQGLSTAVLRQFDDGVFDWVYIDTDHSFPTTIAELEISASKVKSTGRILGHDFCTGNIVTPVPYGVIQACNKFCVENGWQYEYITLDSDGHFSFSLVRL